METSQMIIEKVAPVFNKKGYVGTSIADITREIQLTKGAVYCNFENKEELALKVFNYNVRNVINPLLSEIDKAASNSNKLFAITKYYRKYYSLSKPIGGCPVLKVSSDAKFNNPKLFQQAKKVSEDLMLGLKTIISNGKRLGEIKDDVNEDDCAKNMYSMIQGAIFMAFTHDDERYLLNVLDHIDQSLIGPMLKTD